MIELNSTNVSMMTNLKILYASGSSGINDQGIRNLKLTKLNSSDNIHIMDVSWMTSLQKLYASGITDYGIKNLKLKLLDASNNPNITDVSWMKSLQILIANGTSRITDEGIKNLTFKHLYAYNNLKIFRLIKN